MERHDQVNDFMLSYGNILGSIMGDPDEDLGDEFTYEEGSYGGPSQ